MSGVRTIPVPAGEPRVESGAVRFGDDWPGVRFTLPAEADVPPGP